MQAEQFEARKKKQERVMWSDTNTWRALVKKYLLEIFKRSFLLDLKFREIKISNNENLGTSICT